ncbi:Cyclase dehydrase family protein, partial [Aspergillus sp. HF37]
STVTARDPQSGDPTRAFLTVGYGPLTETFTSDVRCDRNNWVVEAKSGAKSADSTGAAEDVFEFLNTKWVLHPLEGSGSERGTRVDLEIALEFRSRVHAAMLGAVKGEMAGVMIEAFEKRIREVGV